MATCFCRQPCEKHKFGSDAWRASEKARWEEFIEHRAGEMHKIEQLGAFGEPFMYCPQPYIRKVK